MLKAYLAVILTSLIGTAIWAFLRTLVISVDQVRMKVNIDLGIRGYFLDALYAIFYAVVLGIANGKNCTHFWITLPTLVFTFVIVPAFICLRTRAANLSPGIIVKSSWYIARWPLCLQIFATVVTGIFAAAPD